MMQYINVCICFRYTAFNFSHMKLLSLSFLIYTVLMLNNSELFVLSSFGNFDFILIIFTLSLNINQSHIRHNFESVSCMLLLYIVTLQ